MPQDEVQVIKERLIGLMISSPANIQAQLGDAISVIADSDFWRRWDTLTQVRGQDFEANILVLTISPGTRQPVLCY